MKINVSFHSESKGKGVALLLLCLFYPLFGFSEILHQQDPLHLLREGVHEATLSNGMRVILYKRGSAPVFSAVMAVRVGGTDEVPGETGIAHLFEHMAFKGTERIGSKDIAREKVLLEELEEIAAYSDGGRNLSLEMKERWQDLHKELAGLWETEAFSIEFEKLGAVNLNASTGPEITKYYVSLPRQAFEYWCLAESDFLLRPVMRQFYQEREVVREEQRNSAEDDPIGRLREQFFGTAFLMHAYRQPVIGYVDDIDRLTARKLEAFRKKYYVPGNIVLSLVGDVDPERDIPVLEEYFAALPAGPLPQRPVIKERKQDGERRFVINLDSSPELVIGYKKPAYPDPDDARIIVLLDILAGRKTSPLYQQIVEKQRIATDIGASEGPGEAYPNLAVFYSEPRAPHTNHEVLTAFDRIIQQFKKEGASQEDLDIAKRTVAVAYLHLLRSDSSIAETLASAELLHGGWSASLKWYDEIMRVSLDDIKRVANIYLRDENRTVGMLEKKASGKAMEANLRRGG